MPGFYAKEYARNRWHVIALQSSIHAAYGRKTKKMKKTVEVAKDME